MESPSVRNMHTHHLYYFLMSVTVVTILPDGWKPLWMSLWKVQYSCQEECIMLTLSLTPTQVLGAHTSYSRARSVWSSMSTLAISTLPFCFATIFSSLGPRILQGPHHLQVKKRTLSLQSGKQQQQQARRWLLNHKGSLWTLNTHLERIKAISSISTQAPKKVFLRLFCVIGTLCECC